MTISTHARSGPAQVFSEFIATLGLLFIVWGCAKDRSAVAAFAVGAYIAGAYWFTASTSFANPAVTIARCLTNSFSGIQPSDAPAFIIGQLLGAGAATWLFHWLASASPQ